MCVSSACVCAYLCTDYVYVCAVLQERVYIVMMIRTAVWKIACKCGGMCVCGTVNAYKRIKLCLRLSFECVCVCLCV